MSGKDSIKFGLDGTCLYVHVPFCRTKCRYCNFYSVPIAEYDAGTVVSAMLAEMQHYNLDGSTKNLYIGGGSPSSLPPELLLHLVDRITLQCPVAGEFTVEVNPGQVNEILLKRLRKAGVNRLSIGAQSFIQQELDFLGRAHTADAIRDSVQKGRAWGFDNINLDLIFAIPGSNLDSWKQNLRVAIELEVDHISTYALTYEDNTPISRALADNRRTRKSRLQAV
jgi:oxygen-independent coproporphyrinogen-3 oxidase